MQFKQLLTSKPPLMLLLALPLLVLSACGGSSGTTAPVTVQEEPVTVQTNPDDLNAGRDIIATENVYAFRRTSVYADVLGPCVLINTVAASCTLGTLPYIGNGTDRPTIDQIMDRVLVTHDWMGQRFEQYLEQAPGDLIGMFSSVTAILLGSDVRPSYYTTLNGGIQLDPAYLWLSVAEKETISLEEDSRTNYGSDLQFSAQSRRVRNGQRAYNFYSLSDDETRSFNEIILPLSRLLYHELAHASDYMPRWELANVITELSVYENIDLQYANRLSRLLQNNYPLLSEEMDSLAKVRYRDNVPSDVEKTYTATDVGEFMKNDGAVSFYSYLTDREDIANLVDGAMMAYHYDVERNVGFTNKPTNEDATCDDYLVGWGQRNRVGSDAVLDRAYWAVTAIVGSGTAIDNFFSQMPESVDMTPGVNWCDNQNPAAVASLRANITNEPTLSAEQILQEQLHELPSHEN